MEAMSILRGRMKIMVRKQTSYLDSIISWEETKKKMFIVLGTPTLRIDFTSNSNNCLETGPTLDQTIRQIT